MRCGVGTGARHVERFTAFVSEQSLGNLTSPRVLRADEEDTEGLSRSRFYAHGVAFRSATRVSAEARSRSSEAIPRKHERTHVIRLRCTTSLGSARR